MFPARFGLLLLVLGASMPTAVTAGESARHELVSSWHTSVVHDPLRAQAVPSSSRVDGAPWRAHVVVGSLPSSPSAHRPDAEHHDLAGLASFYWQEQQTASGERFDKSDLTAAHRTLPFGTRVRVTHLGNGRSVIVRINDRGPFKPGRVIDLSHAAAEALAMTGHGLARVRLEVMKPTLLDHREAKN